MSDESGSYDGHIVSIGPHVRDHVPPGTYGEEMRARAFILWATEGGRNLRATRRLLSEELEETGLPTPSVVTLSEWSREEQWSEQADGLWRSTKFWGARALQTLALANAMLGQRRRHEILTGSFTGDTGAALVMLKAGELSDKLIRDVLPLAAMMAPPEATGEDEAEQLTSGEKAIVARQRLIQRVKGAQVATNRTQSVEERKRELSG
jgi:hypothetical protein